MQLDAQQLDEFERTGFLIFPGLFSREEVDALVRECERQSSCGPRALDQSRADHDGCRRWNRRCGARQATASRNDGRRLKRGPMPGQRVLSDG